MNVLLISPAIKNYRQTSMPPMGLISIATFLIQRGHNVKIVDRLIKGSNIEKSIEDFKPDFVGVALMYIKTIDDACKCSIISHQYGAKVVWGGILAGDVPEIVLNEEFVDFVIIGEGEYAWHELLCACESGEGFSNIRGLAYKENGRITINQPREFCSLADLPPMDFSLVNPKDYFKSNYCCKNQVQLYASKGCPGRCAFCWNTHVHQSTHRKRPIEHIMQEIRSLVIDYGADGIYLEDEILRTKSKDIAEVCEAFNNSDMDFVWGCKMRIGILTPEDFELMYESGCRWIWFGVETASDEMCKSIHKGIKIEDVGPNISNCAKSGILPISSFIVGLPDETCEQMKETIELAKTLKESLIYCNLFLPLFASEYHEKLVSTGKIKTIKKLEELKVDALVNEKFYVNFSKIPIRDLKVTRAYFFWWSFTTKPPSRDDTKYSFLKKAITETFGTIRRIGFLGFVAEAYSAFYTAVSFGVNLFFFPKIKKKYGLTLNRNRK